MLCEVEPQDHTLHCDDCGHEIQDDETFWQDPRGDGDTILCKECVDKIASNTIGERQ
jgi:hypothetical protein